LRRVLAFVANDDASGRSFAIHSLLGHAPDEVADILAALGLRQGVFWLHDFASLCAGFHLLRNEVEDCGAPPPGSAACNVCLFGPWRDRHIQGHARLFERLDLQVAAPSRSALDLWRRATKLPATGTHVLPHARLMPLGPSPIPPARRPFLIAYAGFPAPHKGWAIFRNLAARFGQDPRYEFIHLGAHPDLAMPHRFERVEAVADNPQAMKMALEAVQADAVLVWPLCRETFSFVAYEAAAAGCAVITGPDSGNVAAFVRERGHGQVIDNEAELAAAFETGTILQLARAERRPMLYDLVYSALTLDLATSSSP
jgi:glycosyltransferase involved in cell wall biosynthesis